MLAAIFISLCGIIAPEVQDTLLRPASVTTLKEMVSPDKIASPISVIQKEGLRRRGTYRPNMLSGIVPGLHIPANGASLTSTIYLRGLGSRMENPSMALYLDGIPVMDKNAYDFDWEGIRNATMVRGPQGTLYGSAGIWPFALSRISRWTPSRLKISLVFPKWEAYIRGENLANADVRSFYFKSIGNEFFASARPRILLVGLSIKM